MESVSQAGSAHTVAVHPYVVTIAWTTRDWSGTPYKRSVMKVEESHQSLVLYSRFGTRPQAETNSEHRFVTLYILLTQSSIAVQSKSPSVV